jgi:pimeloyl-ACP methyl ester carboxylesterase
MPTVDLAGRGTVACRWVGEGPEIVVLVNGSVFNYHQWDRRCLPILQKGLGARCRFLQYDYVGVGGSSAKMAPFSMLDLADELRDLLDALAITAPVHLLGISKGSLVGQAFLIRHRERAGSFCGLGNANIVPGGMEAGSEAGGSEPLPPSEFQARLEALEELRDIWPQRINRQNYARLFNAVYVPALFSKPYAHLSLLERLNAFVVRRMIYPALEGTFIQTMVDLFRYYVGEIAQETPTFAEELPKIHSVPILLLNGTADETTPLQAARALAELLPEAEFVEFEGVTHMGPMLLKDQAEPVFGQYVAFMDRLLAPGAAK